MPIRISVLLLASLLSTGGACGEPSEETSAHSTGDAVTADRPIEDVLRDHSEQIMRIDGVVSVGQALCGQMPCIRVGVRVVTDSIRHQIPDTLEGHPVDVHEIGTVRPLDGGS